MSLIPSPAVRVALPLALVMAMSPGRAWPQIATDRPDFVESSATIGRGAIQIETSIAYEATGSASLRSAAWSTPTLLRVGVGAMWELRVESDLLIRDASSPGRRGDDGVADASVGVKWHALDGGGWIPSTALILHADLPSGSEPLRGEGVGTSLRAVAEFDLPARLAAGVMPGVSSTRRDGERHLAGILGVVLGLELTSSVRAFGEIAFERVAGAEHGGSEGTWNVGLAWLVTDRFQLDAAASLGATRAAPEVGFTVGLSRLFGPRRES
ncbi:MAG: transporter [Longimicrobiales bacterium]|nr:transporter [Longimicrobiales bacterium]